MGGEAWGPWIEHDGLKCPVPVGTVCLIRCRDGAVLEAVAGCSHTEGIAWRHGRENDRNVSCWTWAHRGPAHPYHREPSDVVRYRVRNLSALFDLERVAETPAPVRETEAA